MPPRSLAPAAESRTPGTDPADEAMVARARERFAAEHRKLARRRRHAERSGALPNLIVVGGLKCGTTSLHHYLSLHPEIAMSRPKELNFFVAELNWDLGPEWYASHFDREAPVRGETSPHYTNLPRFAGVAERMHSLLGEDARIVYMVRDPLERILSHYLHNVGAGYEAREMSDALLAPASNYLQRSRYAMQLAPYTERFGAERVLVVDNAELAGERQATMRRVFEFCGVDAAFTSEQFERQWETGSARAKEGGFRLMDRAVRLPGLRAIDRNFDRLPESLRWMVEKVVHDPEAGPAAKPELPDELRSRILEELAPDIAELEGITSRRFGWVD
ncbi:MAG TPA: sulfotransferase [Solirubrobacterales bacterium]|nr:sulfotransferase [Solirubrobacterales bacterium]